MRKTAAAAALILALQAWGYSQDSLTGEEIAVKAHNANRSSQGLVIKGRMTMTDLASRSSESRGVVVLSVREGGLSKSLIRFSDSSYRGTTMLTMERGGQNNLQYLFLPSVGSPRQIEGSDREKSFVDTDFSNEDLGGSRVEDYTYKRLADRNIAGKNMYVIERYPKNSTSSFSRHVVTIDPDTMIPLDVQFFGRSGRVVKTIRAADVIKVGNSIHIPRSLIVVDLEKKRQTEMKVESASEKMINRGYFNRNRMSVQWAEQ